MFTDAELRALRYLVAVAGQVIPSGHPSRPHAETMRARVDAELAIARERSETDCLAAGLERDEIVSTAQAARILGCSQRRIQQRIACGELAAELVGRTYYLHRRDIA